jgi:predicted nucleic acid-binding Zn ribbon protein
MESIQQLIGHLERNPQWQAQAQFRRIVALWPTVVGPAVSQHSRPTGLQQQVLQVAVSSAAWAQTLTLERLNILQKLRDRLPADSQPRDLRFSPGRWASAPQGTPLGQLGADAQRDRPVSRRQPQRERPSTAVDAFNQWAERLQAQQADQPACPHCQRPCPATELARWSCCSLCATAAWQHAIAGHRT